MFKSFTMLSFVAVLLISTALTVAVTSFTTTTTRTSTPIDVYGQTGSMAMLQNIGATYAVSIVPGAAQKSNLIHYYPPSIAVPVGTTIAWV
jgi:hypothetical protein